MNYELYFNFKPEEEALAIERKVYGLTYEERIPLQDLNKYLTDFLLKGINE